MSAAILRRRGLRLRLAFLHAGEAVGAVHKGGYFTDAQTGRGLQRFVGDVAVKDILVGWIHRFARGRLGCAPPPNVYWSWAAFRDPIFLSAPVDGVKVEPGMRQP